jgi:CheY-like chemotaxis protein
MVPTWRNRVVRVVPNNPTSTSTKYEQCYERPASTTRAEKNGLGRLSLGRRKVEGIGMTHATLPPFSTRRPEDARILFVDDDPSMRTLVTMNLESEGFLVSTAEDGDSGLEAVERLHPDLVVLDVMMPGRDGIEVLTEMRARSEVERIPVVLLTAKATDSDVWQGWSAGADYYMTKPFKPEDLLSVAHHILCTAPQW